MKNKSRFRQHLLQNSYRNQDLELLTKKSNQKYADLGKGQWWGWWLLEGLRVEAIDMDGSSVPIRLRAA